MRIIHRLTLLSFPFMLAVAGEVYSQQNFFDNSSIVARMHYGYVWAHRERIEHLVTGHTSGFEISFQKQTDGSQWWQTVRGYPQTGYTFIHLDLANDAVLGDANAVMAFIAFPIVRNPSFLFSFHLSEGIAYLSKRFQREEDHKNVAIGTHVNAVIQLMADTRYRLSKKLLLNLGYGLTHFSNGSLRVPNLGINNISINGGLTYQISEPDSFRHVSPPPLDRRWHADVNYAFGVKENYPPGGRQYFAHTFCFTFVKPHSYNSAWGVGGDVFYDLSLMNITEDSSFNASKIIRSGVHGSYELMINKITVLINMGVYLYDPIVTDGSFYHRIGFKYQISHHLFANFTLKSHFAKADYNEWGIGWRIY